MGTDYQDARQKMVDNQIRTTDVTSHSVLKAFLTVAREDFVPSSLKPLAYIDDDLQISSGNDVGMERYPHGALAIGEAASTCARSSRIMLCSKSAAPRATPRLRCFP
jgi:protein-L-isoaspartate O-methyltransferase